MMAMMSPRSHYESLSPRPTAFPFSAVEETFDSLDFPFGCGSFGAGARMMMPTPAFDVPYHVTGANGGAYIIRVETPGVKQEHLQVELLGRRSLLISTLDKDLSEDAQEQQQNWRQRQSQRLCKRVDLPCDADWASVQLRYADGLLTVEVAQKKHENEAEEEGEE
eukprot:3049356-Rhodomonas_salina.1